MGIAGIGADIGSWKDAFYGIPKAGKEAADNNKEGEYTKEEMLQIISDRMEEIYEKVKNNDTETSFQIGSQSFTIKEWNRILEQFDAVQEEIREQMREEQAKQQKETTTKVSVEAAASVTSKDSTNLAKAAGIITSEPSKGDVGNTDNEEVAQKAAELTNTNYLLDYSKKPISNIVNSVIKGIYWLYRIVNGILLINCLISIIWAFIKIIKKIIKHIRIDKVAVYLQFSSFVCLGIGLAYSLAISWFSEFIFLDGYNPVILNFYMVGLPAVLTFSYFLSFVYTMNYLVRRKTT